MHDGSNDADSCNDVPFWFFHMAPHLGGQTPHNPHFGGVNMRFHAKLAKTKNAHKITSSSAVADKPARRSASWQMATF